MRGSGGRGILAAGLVAEVLGCAPVDDNDLCRRVDEFATAADDHLDRVEQAFAEGEIVAANPDLGLGGDKRFPTEDAGDIALIDAESGRLAYQCATIIGAKGERAGLCLEGEAVGDMDTLVINGRNNKSVAVVRHNGRTWVDVGGKDAEGVFRRTAGLMEDGVGCAVDTGGGDFFYVDVCVQRCRKAVGDVNNRLLGFMNKAQRRTLRADRGK